MVYNSIRMIALILFFSVGAAWAQPVRTEYVESELIAENTSIQPGQPFWVALRLKMDEHWHTYWRNPGDSGMPTTIKWALPDGFTVGPIQWPYPQEIAFLPLVSYGYEGEVFLLSEITPPSSLQPGQSIAVGAYASWLVCKDICLPGESGYSVSLPVNREAPQPDIRWADAFAKTRAQLPISVPDWKVTVAVTDTLVKVHATPPAWFQGTLSGIRLFPYSDAIVDHAAGHSVYKTASGYLVTMRRSGVLRTIPPQVEGVLVAVDGWRGKGSEPALAFLAPVEATVPFATGPLGAVGSTTLPSEVSGIWAALALAFAGGLILNLMPCVLPVLSIKVLGFVRQAGDKDSSSWRHGATFAAGVLMSFLALAGALLALRAGGEQLGWGFQLQSPAFLVVLSSFVFLFGLSLFGVFEIGTSVAGAGGRLDSKSGYTGSFASGVLATVVATPCTAPFMGPALGFALVQPPALALAIFASLGFGMAAPYLLLSSVPSLLRYVPKPGAWMESFKQFMGFLMMATVVWLVWVLALQTDPNFVATLLGCFVLLSIGAWVVGRWAGLMATTRSRVTAWTVAVTLTTVGIALPLWLAPDSAARPLAASGTGVSASGLKWEPFNQRRVNELLAKGSPIFIDFTAAWCLSCQVNERVVLNNREVVEAFEKKGLIALKADWTSRDPEITAALAAFGRNSVPLYVLYTGNSEDPPKLLPEILTTGAVMDALEAIKPGVTAQR